MKKILFGLTAALLTSAAAANTLIPDVSPRLFRTTRRYQYYATAFVPLRQRQTEQKFIPVAVGKAMTQTNLGEHKIGAKAYNPVWHIPKSIQKRTQ